MSAALFAAILALTLGVGRSLWLRRYAIQPVSFAPTPTRLRQSQRRKRVLS